MIRRSDRIVLAVKWALEGTECAPDSGGRFGGSHLLAVLIMGYDRVLKRGDVLLMEADIDSLALLRGQFFNIAVVFHSGDCL